MSTTINIALQAKNNNYVSIASSGNVLHATSGTIGQTEAFVMTLVEPSSSSSSASSSSSSAASEPGWHEFSSQAAQQELAHLIAKSEQMVTLTASNGKFVTNTQSGADPLAATAADAGPNEQFAVAHWDPERIVLVASNKKYVQLTSPASELLAQSDAKNASIFTFILLDENGLPKPQPAAETQTSSDSATGASSASHAGPSSPAEYALPDTTDVYTICFCGTACTRDEGEVSRPESDRRIYTNETGYIPVRINKEISGALDSTAPSVTIRGVGENDWADPRNSSEALRINGPLNVPNSLTRYVQKYSTTANQRSKTTQVDGWSMPALALHAANLATSSGQKIYNFIGHSRGAVESIMTAWFIYFYGPDGTRDIPINIFAIDPVPGPGEWWNIFTQLPPNVRNYVGVYAWDMCGQTLDKPFMALVPRPNGFMTNQNNVANIYNSWWRNKWKYIADNYEMTDPLAPANPANTPQPTNYHLYACRGRHGTVAGNYTSNGEYNYQDVSEQVTPVPELVYKMARGYLTKWQTTFQVQSSAQQRVLELRQRLNTYHRDFDMMGGGETRTSSLPNRPYVRRLSSISGMNPFNSYYMDNVVGDPPYKMAYPVTADRRDTGWVNWTFL